MKHNVKGLPEACAKLRKHTGWVQATAAQQAGVSLNTWRKWEAGTDDEEPISIQGNDLVYFMRMYKNKVDEVADVTQVQLSEVIL